MPEKKDENKEQDVLENVKSIKKTTDEVALNVDKLQSELNKNNGETSEKIEGLKKEIADGLEAINLVKVTQKTQEDDFKVFMKQSARLKGGDNVAEDEDVKQDFTQYLRKGIPMREETKERLAEMHIKSLYANESPAFIASRIEEQKSMMVGNDPSTGFIVRPSFSNKILKRIFETSPIRQVANVISISGESIKYLIDDEEFESGGWVSEVQARTGTDNSTLGELEIHAHEQYAEPKATQKLLDDSAIDIESWAANKVSKKFSRIENTSFVSGDGAGKPKGFLSYAAWATPGTYERGKVEQVASSGSGLFSGDDLIKLQNTLIEDYQPGSVWLMKRATFTEVMTKKDGNGAYLLNPRIIAEGADKVLLGKGVTFASDIPTIAANSLSIAYGDFQEGYTIVDRKDIRVLRDPFTSKPYIKFYTIKRVGGAVTNYESFKILKLGSL